MIEPNEAVRQALSQAARGTTSGTWMSADPRPGLRMVEPIREVTSDERLYDIMVDVAERAQKDAHRAEHEARARILYDLERIAAETDSHALHVYAGRLRADLYPKVDAE